MSKNKELLLNTAIIFLGKLSSRLIIFLLLPLYTALLDPAEYGIADLITTYITLAAPVITLELEMGVFRYLVDSRGNERTQHRIIHNTLNLYFKITIIYCLLYLLIARLFTFPFKWWVFINILIAIYWGLFLQIARGYGDTRSYAVGSFICGVVTAVTNVVLIKFMHKGAEGILIGSAVGYLACTVYLFFKLRIYENFKPQKGDFEISNMVKYSVPLIPNHVCWWIINAADRTIITAILGSAVNGVYAIAVKFPSAVAGLFYTFQLSWQESAAVHINDKDRKEFFNGVLDSVLRLFGSGCILLIAAMPLLFRIFIRGDGYANAYIYIPLAMFGSLLNCLASTYTGLYTALRQTDSIAKTSTIAGIINVVVDIALIGYIDIYAAFISTAAAYAWMLVYRSVDIKKKLDIGFSSPRIALTFIIFSIVSVCYYMRTLPWIIAGIVIAVIYAAYINRALILKVIQKTVRRIH